MGPALEMQTVHHPGSEELGDIGGVIGDGWWVAGGRLAGDEEDEHLHRVRCRRGADNGLGLADASLVALARRLDTIDIATRGERHFRAVRPLAAGKAFRLRPTHA